MSDNHCSFRSLPTKKSGGSMRRARLFRKILVYLLGFMCVIQYLVYTLSDLKMEESIGASIESCLTFKYPEDIDLNYNNIIWQEYRSNTLNVFLLRAYLDERARENNEISIRILSMIDRLEPNGSLICLIWFSDEEQNPINVQAQFFYIWFHSWGNYRDSILQPFIIDCRISQQIFDENRSSKKMFVSVVGAESCSSKVNNRIEVIARDGDFNKTKRKKKKKKDFVVCVKPLDYIDNKMTHRLIEWIELLRIVGVDLIQFYVYSINANVSRILDYYAQQDLVKVREHTLPGSSPNDPLIRRSYLNMRVVNKRQHELIPYNDCFYENFNDFRFVVLLDVDEMIIPIKDRTWKEMIERVEKNLSIEKQMYSAYSVRNVYFFDRIESNLTLPNETVSIESQYFHMLTHLHRSSTYTKNGSYVKTFFKTDSLIGVHNHFARHCFQRCRRFEMSTSDGHLQHYRSDCVQELGSFCENQFKSNVELDMNIKKYQNSLIRSVSKTLFDLKFIGNLSH